MGQPQYIKQSEKDKYADPNVWKIADSFLDIGEEILRILNAGLARWEIIEIFPYLKNEVRVTKEHPFDLLIQEKKDILPSISVHWTNDVAQLDLLGRGAKSEQITTDYIDEIKDKKYWYKLTANKVLNEIKAFIQQSSPNKVYGAEERFYFNETIEIAIWDNNNDVRTLLYKIVKALLLSEISVLYNKGVKVNSMTGTPQGLFNYDFGQTLYGAEIRLDFRNLTWVEVIQKSGTPVEIKTVEHAYSDIHTDWDKPALYEEVGINDVVRIVKL